MTNVANITKSISLRIDRNRKIKKGLTAIIPSDKMDSFLRGLAEVIEDYMSIQQIDLLPTGQILGKLKKQGKSADVMRQWLGDKKAIFLLRWAYKENGLMREMARDFEGFRRLPALLTWLQTRLKDPSLDKSRRSKLAGRKSEIVLYQLILSVVEKFEQASGVQIENTSAFLIFLKEIVLQEANYFVDDPRHLFKQALRYRGQLPLLQYLTSLTVRIQDPI